MSGDCLKAGVSRASCPAPAVVTGGGYDYPDASSQDTRAVEIKYTKPVGNNWEVAAQNRGTDEASQFIVLQAYALCARK